MGVRGCGVVEKALNLIWGQEDSTIISLIRVLRLVRIFRITRLLQRTKALRELSKLVSMMATCLKADGSVLFNAFQPPKQLQCLNLRANAAAMLVLDWRLS